MREGRRKRFKILVLRVENHLYLNKIVNNVRPEPYNGSALVLLFYNDGMEWFSVVTTTNPIPGWIFLRIFKVAERMAWDFSDALSYPVSWWISFVKMISVCSIVSVWCVSLASSLFGWWNYLFGLFMNSVLNFDKTIKQHRSHTLIIFSNIRNPYSLLLEMNETGNVLKTMLAFHTITLPSRTNSIR